MFCVLRVLRVELIDTAAKFSVIYSVDNTRLHFFGIQQPLEHKYYDKLWLVQNNKLD